MMQEDLVVVPQLHKENPFLSFFKRYFNTNSIKSVIFLSLPIYLSIFVEKPSFLGKILFTIIAFFGGYFFIKKQNRFLTGFLIGIFWFYWIGLSFRYYNLTWMIPIVIFLIALGYGTIFWIIEWTIRKFPKKYYEIIWVILFVFLFDFKPEILIINSFVEPFKITFLIFMLGIYFIDKKILLGLILIILSFLYHPKPPKIPNLKINLISTFISQDKKWQKSYIPIEIENNFKYIKNSIGKYDVVVLPESAFPLFLNMYPDLIKKLKNLSKKIIIVTGALHYKNKKFYNSTYIFENGKINILDKHILVPFGEYIPFPFFQKEINKIFFKGASDYLTSKQFGIFRIKTYKFINAICYEATIEKLYKLKPKYIIALSNDAWFMPSIEPILQRLLIRIYAKKYKKIVFHSINGYNSYKEL